MDHGSNWGRTGKLTICARWAALGPKARAYKRTAYDELAELAHQTPGMEMPQRLNDDQDDSHHEDTTSCNWDTQDFAEQPGHPPALWPCWQWGYKVWQHMADQWRVGGMGGVIGLDLNALPIVEARLGMPTSEQQASYTALRVFARMQQDRWNAESKADRQSNAKR